MKTFAINIVLTLIAGTAATSLIWKWSPAVWGAVQYLGIALLIFGFVLWTIARFQLGASFTVSAQAHQLISRGLYSRIRNPIYVFGSCFIAGFIMVAANPAWLLIFLIIVPLQILRARKESLVLEAKFGEDYRRYRANTWF